ncbi:cell division protein FtsZ [Candidatus Sneabacter namystus]|uniref:Cell division protein FtsZ n=1 Tax=Candidatus Sneabacter namystus TaxID=2601646 RepID=A0A5C0UIF8_9RICK|nr:cell division protein FtsZ [Candidatus Sneabacter namystus]QEK39530.1 cell division protein FtsZ [Candidatus Sneabacter namystus]
MDHDSSEVLLRPIIVVFGVGGAGCNAVNNMINEGLEGARFIAANTDAQSLNDSLASIKIQLGVGVTKGLGAGSVPGVGATAADESREEIRKYIEDANMIFIAAGMGGGTGTGAAPVIAKIAKELGILTVGVVTKPFEFEGAYRMQIAMKGLAELQQYVDTLIVIPNQNLFRLSNERTTFLEAFKMSDDVLSGGVRSITDLMNMPGLINLDFADIRTIMTTMGTAIMGTGESANEEERSITAAEAAISNPLLSHSSIKGAQNILINVTGGMDMTLHEVDNAANHVREAVDNENANIIFGSTFNAKLDGRVRVSIIATGIASEIQEEPLCERSDNKSSNYSFASSRKKDSGVKNDSDVNFSSDFNVKGVYDSEGNSDGVIKSYSSNTNKVEEDINVGDEGEVGKLNFGIFDHNVSDDSDTVQEGEQNYEIPAFLRKKRRKND